MKTGSSETMERIRKIMGFLSVKAYYLGDTQNKIMNLKISMIWDLSQSVSQ